MGGQLYLFRHGRTTAPPDLMVGRADFELSAEGRLQAEGWGDRLAGIRFTLAVSSPLRRAVRTAELILSRRPDNAALRPDPALLEVSLGAWEGRPKRWVREKYPRDWAERGRDMINHPPPGGESLADLEARVWPAFLKLAGEAAGHRHSLIVAHQAVIRVILSRLSGSWPGDPLAIEVPPAGLSILSLDPHGRPDCRERFAPPDLPPCP